MEKSIYSVEKRIFMLDMARKYLTPGFIKRLISELASVGYNAISMHFSEDIGMRLESKKYPWLAGGDYTLCRFGVACGIPEDDNKYITQDEMADIVRYAKGLGMEVIPSFDSPGHMNYIVKKYNAHYGSDIGNYFHKHGKTSIVHGTSMVGESEQYSYSRGIDITNPEAISFVKELFSEYAVFFRELGCTSFDIGGDELLGFGETIDDSYSKWQNLEHWDAYAREMTGNENAVAYDAFLLYMNELSAYLHSLGYTDILMWSDDAYRSFDTGWKRVVELDKSIDIMHWTSSANGGKNNASYYIAEGHRVYNFIRGYCYYTLGVEGITSPEKIEREWNAYTFDIEKSENNLTPPEPNLKGAGFCLWCDNPSSETEDEILENLRPYFTAHIKKLL